MRYIIVIIYGVFAVGLSGSVCAQDGKYSIANYSSIEIANYIGLPVGTLLSSIKEDYQAYWYINTKRYGWLEGMSFIYHYSDSLDVKLSIRVKDYQYLEPYQWPPYWDIDTFMMEKIDSIEFSLIPMNFYNMTQNQKVVHQLWKMRKEEPEVFNALNKIYEIWKNDPDAFQNMMRVFEYFEELK